MVYEHISPVLVCFLRAPSHFTDAGSLSERNHSLPLTPQLGRLDYKCYAAIVRVSLFLSLTTDNLWTANRQCHVKLTFDELSHAPWVKVKGWAMAHLKIVSIEMVRIVRYLSYLVTYLSKLRIIVPCFMLLWRLLLLWLWLILSLNTVKNSTINYLLVVLLSAKIPLDRLFVLLGTKHIIFYKLL